MKYPVGLFTQSFVTPGTLKGKQKQHPTATIVYAQPEDDDDGLPWPFSVNTSTRIWVHPSLKCDFHTELQLFARVDLTLAHLRRAFAGFIGLGFGSDHLQLSNEIALNYVLLIGGP